MHHCMKIPGILSYYFKLEVVRRWESTELSIISRYVRRWNRHCYIIHVVFASISAGGIFETGRNQGRHFTLVGQRGWVWYTGCKSRYLQVLTWPLRTNNSLDTYEFAEFIHVPDTYAQLSISGKFSDWKQISSCSASDKERGVDSVQMSEEIRYSSAPSLAIYWLDTTITAFTLTEAEIVPTGFTIRDCKLARTHCHHIRRCNDESSVLQANAMDIFVEDPLCCGDRCLNPVIGGTIHKILGREVMFPKVCWHLWNTVE